jgi:hypothetical protein
MARGLQAPRRPRKKKTPLAKYWGYLLLVALYMGWFYYGFDPVFLAVLSGLVVFYGLFQAPVPCSARNRDGTFCRENASGLLRGCWRVQHKWQNAIMLFRRQSWAQAANVIFRSISGNAAALGVLVAMVSAAAAVVEIFLKK